MRCSRRTSFAAVCARSGMSPIRIDKPDDGAKTFGQQEDDVTTVHGPNAERSEHIDEFVERFQDFGADPTPDKFDRLFQPTGTLWDAGMGYARAAFPGAGSSGRLSAQRLGLAGGGSPVVRA